MSRPRLYWLIGCQALLCWLETYLISRISWIGKVGIATVHKEYKFLRSEGKTFLLLFAVQLALILFLNSIHKKFSARMRTIITTVLLATALLGLSITFEDFLHTYTHRLLKERFHLGFYLFWFSWIGTCIIFLRSRTAGAPPFPPDPNTPVTPPSPVHDLSTDPSTPSSAVHGPDNPGL